MLWDCFAFLAAAILLAWLCLGICLAACAWVFALVDSLRHEPENSSEKILWLALLLILQWLGAALYLLIRRPQRIRTYGR